jgi:hypothetical protein
VQTTWIKVNRDFGSIFSTLLPGTHAKLEPPENGDGTVLSGLEVKVAFGGVWKESLTELSGGQRSLLALSLILALLLFKPAPMYILDEVDAALDLSHTQNIGAMLRTHFRNSQFIVVSLKEGMFNNANGKGRREREIVGMGGGGLAILFLCTNFQTIPTHLDSLPLALPVLPCSHLPNEVRGRQFDGQPHGQRDGCGGGVRQRRGADEGITGEGGKDGRGGDRGGEELEGKERTGEEAREGVVGQRRRGGRSVR